jgi:ABC-type antimicrobial peptide transport system permease subunit
MKSGLTLVSLGLILGFGAAAGAASLIQSLLFSVEPLEPVVYVGVAAIFASVAILACLVPSLRAARIDPLAALK